MYHCKHPGSISIYCKRRFPVPVHTVQLHVASEWKKGQVGAMVLLKRFRRSALLRDKIVRDKLMTECKSLRNAQNISSSVFVQKLRAVLTSPKEVVLVFWREDEGHFFCDHHPNQAGVLLVGSYVLFR